MESFLVKVSWSPGRPVSRSRGLVLDTESQAFCLDGERLRRGFDRIAGRQEQCLFLDSGNEGVTR